MSFIFRARTSAAAEATVPDVIALQNVEQNNIAISVIRSAAETGESGSDRRVS